MYKIKLVFLGKDSNDNCFWSHQWIDWNGLECFASICKEWKDKEQFALDSDNMDRKILSVIVAETQDCTDNKYQCGSCDNFFAEPDDGACPYCNGPNWVEGAIDEDFDYHCTKCEQFSNKTDKGNCVYCGSGLIAFHSKTNTEPDTELKPAMQQKCFNYCPNCKATDPDIAWGEKDWGSTQAWQNATCQKCGCEFTEVYEYTMTEIDQESPIGR